ncbi:MAG: cytochrome c [bacterium]|nr:cytochrome c [bacterium]
MTGARAFFLACVVVGILVAGAGGLAYIPGDAGAMPEAAADGYQVWRANGCVGCHSLYGQGGTFAPDLTHIHSQRGDDYLREFLANPTAFHPDARRMPRFALTRAETDQLLAFLDWVDEQPTAENWPPRMIAVNGMGGLTASNAATTTTTVALSEEDAAIERGRALFSAAPAACSTCHSLEPNVTLAGPSLHGIADRAWYRIPGVGPEDYIRASILAPSDYVVEGFTDVMQKNFGEALNSQQISDLIAFLMTQEEG